MRKVLIANRGEIALRVICACKEMGIRTVAVYSEADRHSLHVRFADEAICIGPPRSAESYLNVPAVISAAEIADVDAIHPGYGLLSENANFAEVCRASNIKFIGPPPEVTRLMGEKEKARQAMKKAKVPILPGSDGVIQSEGEALEWAKTVGYPVILKASAGGGGRGMRVVRSPEELPGLFQAAQSEAANAFGNGDLYMEKFIERPRHIEFQILADEHGTVALPRRARMLHPAPPSEAHRRSAVAQGHAEAARRDRPHAQALSRSRRLPERRHHRVPHGRGRQALLHRDEHAHSGRASGDRDDHRHRPGEGAVAHRRGEKLSSIVPEVIRHARPCHRVPCQRRAPGEVHALRRQNHGLQLPGGNGVRVDTAQYSEGVVPPYYDSLIAKLITHGADREEAMARMRRALEMFIVEGIFTSIPLHQRIFEDEDFRRGHFDTKFMERFFEREKQKRELITAGV